MSTHHNLSNVHQLLQYMNLDETDILAQYINNPIDPERRSPCPPFLVGEPISSQTRAIKQ